MERKSRVFLRKQEKSSFRHHPRVVMSDRAYNRDNIRGYALIFLFAFFITIVILGIVTNASGKESWQRESDKIEQIDTPAISSIFHENVLALSPKIIQWSRQFDIDPNIIAIIIQIESCGNQYAISRSGARGLFQVMPYHFAAGEDPFNADTNAVRGLQYFTRALQEFDYDLGMSFVAYNAGITGAKRSWSNETKRYHYWAMGIYQDIRNGLEKSPTLQEWYSSGGASLCND